MDDEDRERCRDRDEHEHQQAIVGAAALGDRHDREPGCRRLRRHAVADQGLGHRRQAVDHQARQDAGQEAQRGQHQHRGEREAVDLVSLCGRRAARAAEEGDAERLDEAGRRQRRRQRQQRPDRRHQEFEAPLRQLGALQDRLEGQPFGDEAVERRQRGDRDAADQEGEAGERHAVDQPAQVLHVALAGGRQHGAGAEEQQALEQHVVEDVEQRRGQRQRRRPAHAVGLKRHGEAEADEDDADILDRVVGEQALEVVLHQGVEHAHDRGDAAQREDHHGRPPAGRAEQVEHDAHEAVDRDLGHDPAHQRRDVAGCRRMGQRQPDMERHQPGLGAGAEQGQGQHQGGGAAWCARRGSMRSRSRRRGRQAGRRPAAAPGCRSSP